MGYSLYGIRVIIGHQTNCIHVIYQLTKIIMIHETRSISEKKTILLTCDFFNFPKCWICLSVISHGSFTLTDTETEKFTMDLSNGFATFFTETHKELVPFITARIRSMGKVLFSQVCVCPHSGGGSSSQDNLGYLPPPARTGLGYPPPPQTEQQSEHLLHGGRYASCVQVGGLSCIRCNLGSSW